MKSLGRTIQEELLHENKFMKIDTIFATESSEQYDKVLGFVDKDTYLQLAIYVDGEKLGKRFAGLFQGIKYLSDSDKQSFSKMWTIEDIPAKWQNHFEELSQYYDEIVASKSTANESAKQFDDITTSWKVMYYIDSEPIQDAEILSMKLSKARQFALKQLQKWAKAHPITSDSTYWCTFTNNVDIIAKGSHKVLDEFDARVKVDAMGKDVSKQKVK